MFRRAIVCLFVIASSAIARAAPVIEIKPDVSSGIYAPGQEVIFQIRITDRGSPVSGKIEYAIRNGGQVEVEEGTAELREDGRLNFRASRDDPGTILMMIRHKAPDGSRDYVGFGGAVCAPEKIAPSAPSPDDFDDFWKAKIAELDAVPSNVVLEQVDVGDPKIEYFKITMDNIRGSKIRGQIARPAGGTNLPALLQVQWAGVYALQRDWVLGHARNGWLAMNIIAHDLPIDEKPAFYAQKANTELRDYAGIGNDDRETSYFLRMFLSCRRSVDYLAQRPDWNKQTLVVHGGSQGGYQALVTAGLHPAVTALAANVPAGCDHTGKQAGRSPGWPNWTSRRGKDAQKMLTAARYFDAMNFARRIQCPALVGVGLADTTCPAEGVLATYNLIEAPKEIVIMPSADHNGDHQAYNIAFTKFLEKQKKPLIGN